MLKDFFKRIGEGLWSAVVVGVLTILAQFLGFLEGLDVIGFEGGLVGLLIVAVEYLNAYVRDRWNTGLTVLGFRKGDF